MSIKFTMRKASGRIGDESASPVSPSMVDVLPIQGVDTSIGEEMAISSSPRLTEGEDPFRVDPVRWAILDVLSIMVEEDLKLLRNAYKVLSNIGLMLSEPNERACFLRRGCTALHLHAFMGGMRLSLHLFFRRILHAYGLTPMQMALNGWSQMAGVHTYGLGIHLV
ncbi:Uncharacterized protein Adt_15058 [Abeliophyllum distichum]|uniref:Transposase (putative) gypsy type domain-containing protein n=1 Tax=Abeliophyllum distichum TaxID=126358 RepID=A0ABD1U1E5_9LAMI